MSCRPELVLLFSGKRKSGKDHLTSLLQTGLKFSSVLLRLAGPIKMAYAREHNLDYEKLMGSDSYKELYRDRMVAWGEAVRERDEAYFCREAIKMFVETKEYDLWMVTDCRRESDIRYFKNNYQCITVRIVADETTRKNRGFVFTKGIDDRPTECGLDAFGPFDFVLDNSVDEQASNILRPLMEEVINRLTTNTQDDKKKKNLENS